MPGLPPSRQSRQLNINSRDCKVETVIQQLEEQKMLQDSFILEEVKEKSSYAKSEIRSCIGTFETSFERVPESP